MCASPADDLAGQDWSPLRGGVGGAARCSSPEQPLSAEDKVGAERAEDKVGRERTDDKVGRERTDEDKVGVERELMRTRWV